MNKIKTTHHKKVLKDLIKVLFNNEQNSYMINNCFRDPYDHGVTNNIITLLEKFPESKKRYDIVAFTDSYQQRSVPTDGWGLLGGPRPDSFTINGRHVDYLWNHKIISYDDKERNEYFKKRYQKCFGTFSKGNITLTIMVK